MLFIKEMKIYLIQGMETMTKALSTEEQKLKKK